MSASRYLPSNFQIHSKQPEDALYIPTENLPNTLQILSRQPPDTLETPFKHPSDTHKTLTKFSFIPSIEVRETSNLSAVGGWVVYRYIIMPLRCPSSNVVARIQAMLNFKFDPSVVKV